MYYQEIIVRVRRASTIILLIIHEYKLFNCFKARPNYQHIIAPTKQKTSRCECFNFKETHCTCFKIDEQLKPLYYHLKCHSCQ